MYVGMYVHLDLPCTTLAQLWPCLLLGPCLVRSSLGGLYTREPRSLSCFLTGADGSISHTRSAPSLSVHVKAPPSRSRRQSWEDAGLLGHR